MGVMAVKKLKLTDATQFIPIEDCRGRAAVPSVGKIRNKFEEFPLRESSQIFGASSVVLRLQKETGGPAFRCVAQNMDRPNFHTRFLTIEHTDAAGRKGDGMVHKLFVEAHQGAIVL